MKHLEFGECLDYLLKTLGISINRLAKAINVDNSLANRWVNGKRVPTYNSLYIEDITNFLADNIKNSIQINSINTLFLEMFGDNAQADTPKEKIKKILYEAQGYSLEIRKKKQAENAFSANKKIGTPQTSSSHLSVQDTIVHGSINTLVACNDLLNSALNSLSPAEHIIYLTYFNELPLSPTAYEHVINFQSILLRLLDNGWEIHFLARINNNTQRTIRLINFVKPFINMGKFFISCLDYYDYVSVSMDYIIVSDYCAFTGVIINSFNAGVFFRTPSAVELYTDYVKNLIFNHGRPLVNYYPLEKGLDYNFSLAKCEDSIGKRYLFKDCFGTITIPEDLYRKLLKRRNLSPAETKKALVFYNKRLEAFLHHISAYEHVDLYPVSCINHLIRNQLIYLYDHTGISSVEMEVEEIIQLLENIVCLLKKFENYHIVFVSERSQTALVKNMFYCLVKEKKSVFVLAYNPQNKNQFLRMTIDAPMVVFAFEAYLRQLWQEEAPVLKNKSDIIEWLEREIELLRNRVKLHKSPGQ